MGVTVVLPSCGECPMSTTSLKLPNELKTRAAAAAKARGISTHAFMLNAVEQATSAAERREKFIQSGLDALEHYERTGEYYDWHDSKDYFLAKVEGKNPTRPKLRTRK